MSKNYFLQASAKEAFKGYVRAYAAHHHKDVFNIETLDLKKVRCFTLYHVEFHVLISIMNELHNKHPFSLFYTVPVMWFIDDSLTMSIHTFLLPVIIMRGM